MADKPVAPDQVQVEANFSRGIVRDSARSLIPEGGVYDAVDFMLEQPGRIYKRGGWVPHSAPLGDFPSMVGTLHIPTRVVAIVDDDLYDVTSEGGPEANLVGTVGFAPGENPTYHVGKLIVCHSQGLARPKKVYTTGPTGDVTLDDLGGTPPYAAHSAVYASRLVLARGDENDPVAGEVTMKNRIWFSPLPDIEASWAYTSGLEAPAGYIDATYEITGLAAIYGVLLVFSPRFTERIIGGVPPGTEGENMELQPVGGVGCLDARSIVTIENQVVFASQEGVFRTNGVGFENLMESADHSGILSYWRSLFVEHQVRSVVSGLLGRNYLYVSSSVEDGGSDNFLCYLPTRTWTRLSSFTAANMYAQGATEQETNELYVAMHSSPVVAKFSPMLKPQWSNRFDGTLDEAMPVEPSLELRMFGQGPGLKAYGFGRVSYAMHADPSIASWLPSHSYVMHDLVFEQGIIWHCVSASGLSGATNPFVGEFAFGTGPTDGAIVWHNDGPYLHIYEELGIDAAVESEVIPSPLRLTGAHIERKRFRLFRDSQGLYLRFVQNGPTAQTEIELVEVEYRPYTLASDGESSAAIEYA